MANPENNDQPPHMWEYWRDKKGLEQALTEYYPAFLKDSDVLRAAFALWKAQEIVINAIMREREDPL